MAFACRSVWFPSFSDFLTSSSSTCKFVIGACECEGLFVSFDELATCPECTLLLAKC